MKTGDLANQCLEVCLDAQRRIIREGEDSYTTPGYGETPEKQRFEEESLHEELQGLEEELLDAINWAAMAVLKIRAARKAAGQ